MKKNLMKFSGFFASFAFLVAVMSANRTCIMLINQPELPKSVKALRKF